MVDSAASQGAAFAPMRTTTSAPAADAAAAEAAHGRPTVPLTAIVKSATGSGGYAAFTVERQGEA